MKNKMFLAKQPLITMNSRKINNTLSDKMPYRNNHVESWGNKNKLNQFGNLYLEYKKALDTNNSFFCKKITDDLYTYSESSKKNIPTNFFLKDFNGGNILEKNYYDSRNFLNIKLTGSKNNRLYLINIFKYLVNNKLIFTIK